MKLRIMVEGTVPGVWGAIQAGSGSKAKPHGVIQNPESNQMWEIDVEIKDGKIRGPFVQKDSKGQFVYLLWGTSAGQFGSPITRRAKIYFPPNLDFPSDDLVSEVRIAGWAKDGGPCCATVPLLSWKSPA